jgi:hypothetical protein
MGFFARLHMASQIDNICDSIFSQKEESPSLCYNSGSNQNP